MIDSFGPGLLKFLMFLIPGALAQGSQASGGLMYLICVMFLNIKKHLKKH